MVLLLFAAATAAWAGWHSEIREMLFKGTVIFEKGVTFNQAPTFVTGFTSSGSIVATNIETALSATTLALNADGNTTIYTVPAGKRCVLTKAVLVVGADAGSTDFTIGQAGALTDFLGTQQCDNLNAANDAGIFMPVPNATASGIKSYAAGTVIKAVVANHAGGATNTLYLFGFLY